eukprot:8230965-Alexandrium_andersonii.AAC.1
MDVGRHLEEDREAIVEEMSESTQGLASASSGLLELARNSSRGTCTGGHRFRTDHLVCSAHGKACRRGEG